VSCVFGGVHVAHLFSFLSCVFGGVCVDHLFSFLCCVVYFVIVLFVSALCLVYPMLPVYLDCPFLIDSSVSLTFIEWGKCFELSYRKSDYLYDCKHFPSKKPPGANMGVSGFFYTWSVNLLIWSWFLINEFLTRKVWRCKEVTRSHKSKDRQYSDQTKDHKGTNNDLQNI
jgi:hypothetical protein